MNLNFLISTSKSIFSYPPLKPLHTGKGVYFGISKCQVKYRDSANIDHTYIVLGRNNFDGTGGGDTNGINSLIIFNNKLKLMGNAQIDFVKDGHQIFYKDDVLYICNSGLNAISSVRSDGKLAHITFDNNFGQDVCHYNSINFNNDRWYIAQHRNEAGKDNGGVSVYDKDWKFLEYIEVGKHIHNCNVKDGFLWVADSNTGGLVKIELANPSNRTSYDVLKGYLSRGLIITDEYLLCGLSEFDTRENRHTNKNGRISIFKYPTMEFIDQIIIENCGQINDLCLV